MPPHKIPLHASGDWTRLDASNGAELYRRDMKKPDGEPVTIFYAGSDKSPEVVAGTEDEARAAFDRWREA